MRGVPMGSSRYFAIGVFALVLCCALPTYAAPAKAPTTQPTPDQVQFQEKTIEAQMAELQERMFRLADLTRQNEPDDSARLLMALRKAREDLIIEQIRDVLSQLSHSDLDKASQEEQQVLTKLEDLKKLLTSTDLDLQMQLDRLRRLNAAIGKLDAGIREEKRQRDQSGEFAKQGHLDPKALAGPQDEQKHNRQASESIAESLKDLGAAPAKAADTLGNAAQSMSLAEGRLAAANPADAQGLQDQAAHTMQSARDQLEQERQKVLDELQAQVRKQVIMSLTEMLDRQKSVDGATQAQVKAQGPATRNSSDIEQAQKRVRLLAPAEDAIVRIADQTVELIEAAEFSVALPPALKEIRGRCAAVADALRDGVADQPLVQRQINIEQDLQDLLDTFKELAAQPGDPSKCRGCKGNKNKLLAELKVLRLLQARVNQRTLALDARPKDASSAREIAELRDRQQDIQMATQKIDQEITGGDNSQGDNP